MSEVGRPVLDEIAKLLANAAVLAGRTRSEGYSHISQSSSVRTAFVVREELPVNGSHSVAGVPTIAVSMTLSCTKRSARRSFSRLDISYR